MNAVTVKNLSYTYPDGRRGLVNVSLSVEKGSRVALVGSNGSGKSTLLLHLNGLLDGAGEIEVMGIPRRKKNMGRIRRSIGYLFSQIDYQFIMPDLINDVMISIPGNRSGEERAREARLWLARFGLEEYEGASPLELSSGEMKKAALAGVLAREPGLIILDEPLNTIDRRASMELLKILSELPQTMIMATHRLLPVRKLATHIAVMEKGRITGYYPAREGLERKDVLDLLM